MQIKFSFVHSGSHREPAQPIFRAAQVMQGCDAERHQLYLCASLGSVARIQMDCDRFLKHIEDIENGIEAEIETGGNDVALTFRRSGVQVDILINDDWCDRPEGHFELREWKIALEGWRRLLGMPESMESIVEIEL